MRNLPKHLCPEYDAAAYRECMIYGRDFRFTVITSRLIRLEYAADGRFEDMPTQSFVNRKIDKPTFKLQEDDDKLRLETKDLILFYTKNGKFNEFNLKIQLKKKVSSFVEDIWYFGDKVATLGGTARTLDKADGRIDMGEGVCARCGFAYIDDSGSNLILPNGKTAPRKDGIIDGYFFGYARDYLGAIGDLMRLTGIPPLLPDYALGNWWSRYYKYTQEEYKQLMQRFIDEDIPFSVAVLDMDWHKWDLRDADTVFSPYGSTWTGYTWDTDVFPDHKALLDWLHQNNLKVTLNLHPALGIRANESMYKEVAEAMGIDPATEQTIYFDMTNEDFIAAYFDLVHNPLEKEGVDFWWIDWQQGEKSGVKGLDPLWLLNHYHTLDISKDGRRPMIFSRFSGAGSQRFPIGFSGDTATTWESLDFQPEFTATASNIAYPWWSHDIGGHYRGYRDDEMYTRWVQLGVFSPIMRLHSGNNKYSSKEPWNYGDIHQKVSKKFLKLRQNLFPYLYSMNMRVHKDLIPLVCPVYYFYPESPFAYEFKNNYFFGSEMLVLPITKKADESSLLARVDGWLPEGIWFDFFRGTSYTGGRKMSFYRNIEEMPVMCKAGAIVPMTNKPHGDNSLGATDSLDLYVFPFASNSFTLYEDDGDGMEYQNGRYVTTEFSLDWSDRPTFTIHAANGFTSLIPQKRSYTLYFRGVSRDTAVICSQGDISARYDDTTNTLVVTVSKLSVLSDTTFILSSKSAFIPDGSLKKKHIEKAILHAQMDYNHKLFFDRAIENDMSNENIMRTAIYEGFNHSLLGAIIENLE